ncbi:MAG: LysR family transcriptional regulator, partial [Chloroflexi bacterium]|nr:LysR family transcriptional regulator [Chloroflexota bacterium]
ISQAAQLLDYAQSTVTAQIQALETSVGQPLLYRTGKRITALTPAGETLLPLAQRAARLAVDMQTSFDREAQPSGTLVIGASETVLTYQLPALLVAYGKHHPQVRLVIRPFRYEALLDQVRYGNIDLAFLFEQPLRSSKIETTCLRQAEMILVAAPTHPLAALPTVNPQDLEDVTILFTEHGCGYRPLLEQVCLEAGIRPMTNLEFNSSEAIKQCVIAGLGITLLPHIAVATELQAGQLAMLPWSGTPMPIYTQAAWRHDHTASPLVQSMLALSKTMLEDGTC